jgi:hypothetical protein
MFGLCTCIVWALHESPSSFGIKKPRQERGGFSPWSEGPGQPLQAYILCFLTSFPRRVFLFLETPSKVFSRKLRVFIRSHVSEATSPLHGAGGVVFGVYILWVSNGAPQRPSDASKGRPSLTSYNEIVSVPSWPKLGFTKSDCVKLTEVCFAFLI